MKKNTVCLSVPAGTNSVKQNTVCPVVYVPAGANVVINHVVFIFEGFAGMTNCLICMVLSLMSMLASLVLKNLTQRTSQRVKRPSGARVMTCS